MEFSFSFSFSLVLVDYKLVRSKRKRVELNNSSSAALADSTARYFSAEICLLRGKLSAFKFRQCKVVRGEHTNIEHGYRASLLSFLKIRKANLCSSSQEFLATNPEVPGSIPGATRFF
jgi:hypothetical protein